MAKATITYTCKVCGSKTTKSTTKGTRKEADAWEAYAKDAYDTCPACYADQQRKTESDKYAAIAAEYSLPAIVGVSDKQARYAEDMRRNYIIDNRPLIDRVQQMLRKLDSAKLQKLADAANKTPEDFLKSYMRDTMKCGEAYIALTSTDAREIIDTVK